MTATVLNAVSLKPYNTFGFDVQAAHLIKAHSERDVLFARDFAQKHSKPLLLLGGGSNVVFTQDFDGVVLLIEMRGKSMRLLDEKTAALTCQAGENWHDFVRWSLEQGTQGLENLSLIPGTAGAAPVQNIGAYGTDIHDWLHELKAIDLSTGQTLTLTKAECEFAYRDSVFKRTAPQRYVITELVFYLNTQASCDLNLSYGGVLNALQAKGIDKPATPMDVSDVICELRSEKLPDPIVLGNAGSFFKNPVVTSEKAQQLNEQFDGLVAYPQLDGCVKLAAGWLIEYAGFKGHVFGGVGVHDKQALVLVNHGGGTGKELLELAQCIQSKILELFGVELEIEPRVY